MFHNARRRILRYGAAGVLCALLSMAFAQPAGAAPDGDANQPKAAATRLSKDATKTIPIRVKKAGGATTLATAPPAEGCGWEVGLHIDAWYLDGILTGTDSWFAGNITCYANGPDQSMGRLTNITKLYHYNETAKEGNLAECRHVLVTDPPCLGAWSGGLHECYGQLDCIGTYQAMGYLSLVLPAGWVYTGPPPEDCWFSTPREMMCIPATGVLTVSPTNP